MIAFLVVGSVVLGFTLLMASLAVASWQDHQIAQGKRVDDRQPVRESQSATAYVPPSWKPTDDDLRDPTPHDPAS